MYKQEYSTLPGTCNGQQTYVYWNIIWTSIEFSVRLATGHVVSFFSVVICPIIEKARFVFVIFLTLSTLRKMSQWEHTLINSAATKLKQQHYHNRIHFLWPFYTGSQHSWWCRTSQSHQETSIQKPRRKYRASDYTCKPAVGQNLP